MGVPIRLIWKCLIDAVVKVLVVGEDNVTTDIVELPEKSVNAVGKVDQDSTYETFGGNVGRSKTTWNLIGVDDEP